MGIPSEDEKQTKAKDCIEVDGETREKKQVWGKKCQSIAWILPCYSLHMLVKDGYIKMILYKNDFI